MTTFVNSFLLLLKKILTKTISFLYPLFCCHCGKEGSLLCAKCYETILFTHLQAETGARTCAQYQGAMRSLITTMKFKNVRGVCNVLADLAYYSMDLPQVDLVCEVPLHSRRKNQRGFDQAELIAKRISYHLEIPYIPLLTRTKYHTPQSGVKNKAERASRLAGAYSINYKALRNLKKISRVNQDSISILLVDDVYTTGATTNECKKTLEMYFEKKFTIKPTILTLCIARD